MKILEPQSAILSNYEVHAHIQSLQAKPRSTTHKNVETIFKEVSNYLSPTAPTDTDETSTEPTAPTTRSLPSYHPPNYSEAKLKLLMQRLKPYMVSATNDKGLYKNEMLMILNLRPRTPEVLDCVVEECDERFSEEEQAELLRIVGEVLGGDEEDGEDVHMVGAVEQG